MADHHFANIQISPVCNETFTPIPSKYADAAAYRRKIKKKKIFFCQFYLKPKADFLLLLADVYVDVFLPEDWSSDGIAAGYGFNSPSRWDDSQGIC